MPSLVTKNKEINSKLFEGIITLKKDNKYK